MYVRIRGIDWERIGIWYIWLFFDLRRLILFREFLEIFWRLVLRDIINSIFGLFNFMGNVGIIRECFFVVKVRRLRRVGFLELFFCLFSVFNFLVV